MESRLARTRAARARVVAVHCPRWLGITNSTRTLFDHTLAVPSVAEVDHHELWQRSRLTLSCVARDHHEVQQLLDGAERYLGGQDFELARVEREIVSLDD